jgi:GT2 family glycosyltransferase
VKGDLRIAAVVVTYNRKELLRKCLRNLLKQTYPIDEVIVIDNCSTDGTDQMIHSEFPQITHVMLIENIGGAGGFSEGMKIAFESGYDWIWIMDDDALPELTALERLLNFSSRADILVPVLVDSTGKRYGAGLWRFGYIPISLEYNDVMIIPTEMFSFVGPLIRRKVIEHIGFPRKDFFIWADDLEWALRASMAGFAAYAVLDAVIFHDRGRQIMTRRLGKVYIRVLHPPWKYYYEMRNKLLMLDNFRGLRKFSEIIALFYRVLRVSIGDMIYAPEWRQSVYFRWLGIFHGILGKTGKIITPDKDKKMLSKS